MNRHRFTPYGCRAGDEWQALKHSWLERRLLPLLEDSRTECAGGGSVPAVIAGIPARLEVARKLTAEMRVGFSPAQLVDAGPLADVVDDVRSLIRDLVHEAYLDLGIIQEHETRLTAAILDLDAACRRLFAAWPDGQAARALTLDSVRVAAQRLWAEIDGMPGGVVLP